MKKPMTAILAVVLLLFPAACGRGNFSAEDKASTSETEENQIIQEDTKMKLRVEAGGSTFTAALEENEAAAALVEMMEAAPIVIEMRDYSGFEKVGSLGASLPASDSQMSTQAGDIVLYNSSQIVMFYGSNSWSYTKLAEVEDLSGWEEALGNGNVTVTFSIEPESL